MGRSERRKGRRQVPPPGGKRRESAGSHDGAASRQRILAVVDLDPGIHVSEIGERAGLAWHTTAYHLSILKRSGQVVVEKSGRDRCVFPKGIPARRHAWLVAMRIEPAKDVLRVLTDGPLQDIPALAARIGCSEKVVRRRVAHLEEAGLIERIGTWRPHYEVRRGQAAREVAALLRRHGRRHRGPAVVGSWSWDPRRNRPRLSKEAWAAWGVAPKARASCEWFIGSVHPEDRAGLSASLAAAVADGRPHDRIVRVQTAAGERHVRHRGHVTARDARGKATRLDGTVEDVTDSHAAHPRPPPYAPRRDVEGDRKPGQQKSPLSRRLAAGLLGKAPSSVGGSPPSRPAGTA